MSLNKRLQASPYDGRVLEGEDGLVVADVRSHIGEQDARRLAACWNACLKFPTEALEAGALTSLLDGVAVLLASNGPLRGVGEDMVRDSLKVLGRLS